MKGKTFVIGFVAFVLIVVGIVCFAMMRTINNIKEENNEKTSMAISYVDESVHELSIWLTK